MREQEGHEQFHCEATVAAGVQVAGAGNGKQLLTKNVNGAAVFGKLLRQGQIFHVWLVLCDGNLII